MHDRGMLDDAVAQLGWSERRLLAAMEEFIDSQGLGRRYGPELAEALAAEGRALEEEPPTMGEAARIGGWPLIDQVDWVVSFLDRHFVLGVFSDQLDERIGVVREREASEADLLRAEGEPPLLD